MRDSGLMISELWHGSSADGEAFQGCGGGRPRCAKPTRGQAKGATVREEMKAAMSEAPRRQPVAAGLAEDGRPAAASLAFIHH